MTDLEALHGLVEFRSGHHHRAPRHKNGEAGLVEAEGLAEDASAGWCGGLPRVRSVVRLLEAGIILGNENTSRAGLRKERERNERDCAERA
jgi:hypothetical protein